MSTGLSWVINFANSVLGVSLLALPYCFQQCGVILATIMVLGSGYVTKITCEYLLRTGSFTRKNSYEQIACHVYGPLGKLITELSTIGLLIGTLVAFQVVIGDLSHAVVHSSMGVEDTWYLRATLMFLSNFFILPLCLMKNISSLASFNAISVCFYVCFLLTMILMSLPNIFDASMWNNINFLRWPSLFQCLPIILLAFSCQTQVFTMYTALPEPNMKSMSEIISKAINLCSSMYISIGMFGYFAFYNEHIHGDILESFPHGFLATMIKLGFWCSVILSFPLIVFPVRAAINSLLYSHVKHQGVLQDVISSAGDYIAPNHFLYITLGLNCSTLVIGILIPRIEVVLSITGALIGTFLCFVLPTALFIVAGGDERKKRTAQLVLVFSTISMLLSTTTVISGVLNTPPVPVNLVNDGMVEPALPLVVADEKPLSKEGHEFGVRKLVGDVNIEAHNGNIEVPKEILNNMKPVVKETSESAIQHIVPQVNYSKESGKIGDVTVGKIESNDFHRNAPEDHKNTDSEAAVRKIPPANENQLKPPVVRLQDNAISVNNRTVANKEDIKSNLNGSVIAKSNLKPFAS